MAVGAERVGLVGRNGSGKSTLLRALVGEIDPVGGKIVRSGRVAMLRQISAALPTTISSALGVESPLARLQRIEAGNPREGDLDKADWGLKARIETALAEGGLPALALDRQLGSLSGGEQTRLALAAVLLQEPDLILLDEPTNNLDGAGRETIGRLLEQWRGGVIVASHDRTLLEDMDRIVHVSPTCATIVGGGWSTFVAERDAERERTAAELESAEQAVRGAGRSAQRAREKQERRDGMGRARRAKRADPKVYLDAQQQRAERTAGRGAGLSERKVGEAEDRLEQVRSRIAIHQPIRIDLPPTGLPSNREMLAFDAVTHDRLGDPDFSPLSFTMHGPERLAITGPNGSGKSTLLRIATGEITPAGGEARRVSGRLALLDQALTLLDGEESLLHNMRRISPGLSGQEARAALARFAFRNIWADRQAGSLSGGERIRLALAGVVTRAEPPQLLLLDEPTNHLDIESTELLEHALAGYDGAILCVSHDEAFLRAIGVERRIALG
ncbi:ABC-F family ATP-binding cassette domain-containing protein [Parasphingopyxis lamellibrachiae]|uniref:ABC-F family ATP-binding cassette domain-containing protein n=1 Tax=Parasphingopyxis lamellibrachiae TaxID=680125 RepID=UPI00319DEB03